MKPLLPVLKEKKRYISFEVISQKPIRKSIIKDILSANERFLGTLGSAKAGVQFLQNRYDEILQRGIIRVNHKYVDEIKTSLLMINKINNIPVIVRSLSCSGIIKKIGGK